MVSSRVPGLRGEGMKKNWIDEHSNPPVVLSWWSIWFEDGIEWDEYGYINFVRMVVRLIELLSYAYGSGHVNIEQFNQVCGTYLDGTITCKSKTPQRKPKELDSCEFSLTEIKSARTKHVFVKTSFLNQTFGNIQGWFVCSWVGGCARWFRSR